MQERSVSVLSFHFARLLIICRVRKHVRKLGWEDELLRLERWVSQPEDHRKVINACKKELTEEGKHSGIKSDLTDANLYRSLQARFFSKFIHGECKAAPTW